MRRIRILGIVVISMLALLTGCKHEHDSVGGYVFTFNIAGHTQYGGSNDVAADILSSLNARSALPSNVALQEVCGTQFAALQGMLSGKGYYVHSVWHVTSASDCDRGDGTKIFGELLATRLGHATTDDIAIGPNTKAVCLIISVGTGTGTMCTAHFAANDTTTAGNQLTLMATYLSGLGTPSILAGDLNLDSCPGGGVYRSDLNTKTSSFYEADGRPLSKRSTMMSTKGKPCPSTPPSGAARFYKLDYVLFHGYLSKCACARIRSAATSDHAIYEGFTS